MTEPKTSVDFARLYDAHPEYTARRKEGSFEQERTELEVSEFKLPLLVDLIEGLPRPSNVLEIGCGTGELIATFPAAKGGRRVGVDISRANVDAARARFCETEFYAGDFRELLKGQHFDCVIMSDVLEHVPDDAEFLRDAAQMADYVLVNLPLEDNWLNRNRDYGPEDASGHLRKYSLNDGLSLFRRAGLSVVTYRELWVHEHVMDRKRRQLQATHFGHAYTGGWLLRGVKRMVFGLSRTIRPLGRWLFASNLFVLARRTSAP